MYSLYMHLTADNGRAIGVGVGVCFVVVVLSGGAL